MRPPFRLLFIRALVCSTVALQACALSGVPAANVANVAPSFDPVRLASAHSVHSSAHQLDTLNEGDSASFDNGFLSRMGQVSIGREYYSASGRLCKQILNASGDVQLGVACKLKDQQWYTRQGS